MYLVIKHFSVFKTEEITKEILYNDELLVIDLDKMRSFEPMSGLWEPVQWLQSYRSVVQS